VIALFVACRLILAATFLVSGSGKFVGGGDQLANALRLSVPRLLARAGAVAVTPLEFLVAALLLFGDERTFEIGLVGSAGLLIVFSGWMVSVLLRGLQLQCSCFGPSGAAVGWWQVARNVGLAVVAVAGLMVAPSSHATVGSSVWGSLALMAGALLLVLGVAVRRAAPALVLSFEQVRAEVASQEDAYVG
jgi:hypothetical protein